jgi:hypothetical protein
MNITRELSRALLKSILLLSDFNRDYIEGVDEFQINSTVSNFMKIRTAVPELFHAYTRADRVILMSALWGFERSIKPT